MIVRHLGCCNYQETWSEMVQFTRTRHNTTTDEIWLLEHNPVYTQGTSSRDIPLDQGKHIPVVHSDRGGQITYHGPGQLIVYLLLDIKRLKIGPKSLVKSIEQLIIEFLQSYGITGQRKQSAPGVYVEEKKIAALGLRISKGYCYHGLSINIDMDLAPFNWIDPCGYPELEVTQMINHAKKVIFSQVKQDFASSLDRLGLD
jgi:lipoyl(octanoyl) transferase